MFPRDTHSDPYSAPATLSPVPHPVSSCSRIINTSAGPTSIPAETTSGLHLHEHSHLHQFPPHYLHDIRPQQSSSDAQQQWPIAFCYPSSEMAARDAERLLTDQGLLRQQFNQQHTGSLSREEAQMQLLQQTVGANVQMQGVSMMPAVDQFYNEQLLCSFSSRAAGSQFSGIEPRSMYGSLQARSELQMTNQSSSAHVLNRTLENISRSAEAGAGVRYEETGTPRPRWCPTQEQIQILESIFNSGTTTPSRDMIVDIASQLRKFGTIAEANVFYWFQNRKARAKRKLQPPAPPAAPPVIAQPCVSAPADPDHSAPDINPVLTVNTTSGAGLGYEHAAQSKSRRLSRKHGSASSPSSSSSPDPHHVSGGPASPSPLQQQPIKPLHQQDTLLVPNRASASDSMQMNQLSFPSWPQQQFEKLQAEEGQESPATMPYPQFLLTKPHEGGPSETSHAEAFRQLLDYPRISLSLAPPTQHQSLQSSQVLGQSRRGFQGFSLQSDQKFVQTTSKGLMLMDSQGSLGSGPMIGDSSCTSSTIMSSAFLSQLGDSRHVIGMEGSPFSQVQPSQLPQSSLPLARPGDHQVGLKSSTAGSSMAAGAQDEEQLQMWEDLDSCSTLGLPWSGGRSHP